MARMTSANPSVLGGTWTILRARWHIARNTWWRGKLVRKLFTILAILVLIGIAYGLFRFSRFLVAGIQELARTQPTLMAQFGDVQRVLAAVPSLALFSFAIPLLFSSVSFALSTLYLARDLDSLLVTPVPVRAVFLARFLEGLGSTYLLLFLLLAPALIGYGQALHYGPGFFGVLPGVLLLLPLLPVSIGTLLTMVLVRIIPPKRLQNMLTIVGGLFGLIVYIGSQSLNEALVDRLATAETAARLLRFDTPALPTAWAARALVASGTGNIRTFLFYGGLYVAASIGLFCVCLALAERLYYTGWASLASVRGGSVRQHTARLPLFNGPISAIVRKDLRVLPRDIQQLSQFIFPLAIAFFWIWRLMSDSNRDFSALRQTQPFADFGLITIGLFVCILITNHLGLTGLSREGNGYWLLHLAPLDPWNIVWAKCLLAWLPFPVIGSLFVALIGLLQRPPLTVLLQNWLLLQLTGVGVAGITAGLGAVFPKFDWQQPRRMTSRRGGCFGSILYLIYTALMLALTIGAQFVALRFGSWAIAAGWGSAIVLTLAALGVPLWFGAHRLRRLEW